MDRSGFKKLESATSDLRQRLKIPTLDERYPSFFYWGLPGINPTDQKPLGDKDEFQKNCRALHGVE
ncbi:hypothetical protein P152DRAFT_455003 [Eremomyces bilateralis CBS 781.70]|uniref:Uncharacterized protein n=1 Tax=Eremomyces bilateralis CBS 781.70 TaxID=1392243 RepID=A0A6G1GFI9_9PEZI|nr:uncharacterized protein P152DRAFT_455003 [Eremomyces bilateralis CBS 781.70]KAF1816762.1 hypothetical protein P152DRAFT_455003 [Eremomyces bilateralis CBS 781.70]